MADGSIESRDSQARPRPAIFMSCVRGGHPNFPNTMLMKDGDEKPSCNDCGFPPGFFVLHSVSSRRMLDVCSDSVQDGASIVLWPEKDNSLVEGKPSLAYD